MKEESLKLDASTSEKPPEAPESKKFLDTKPNPLKHLKQMESSLEDMSFAVTQVVNQFSLFLKDYEKIYCKEV